VPFSYPILLDVTERPIAIVGGGAVARRKAAGLLAAGAKRVRVIAPKFHPEMPADVERIAEPYDPRHIEGASLVFAATDDPAVNERVVADAHAHGALVNRADAGDASDGDFSVAAVHRTDAGLLLGVWASGNPALAAFLRDRLAKAVDPAWLDLARAMAELRPRVLASKLPPATRAEALRAAASDEGVEAVRRGGTQGLWRWLVERFERLES
jgi:precorrin-2 dehydrogenase/sirohydrochlorin ferrochelatase